METGESIIYFMNINNSKKNVLFAFLYQFLYLIVGFVIRKLLFSNIDILLLGVNSVYENIIAMISLLNFGIGSSSIYYLYKFFSKKDSKNAILYYHAFVKLFRLVAAGIFVLGCILMFFVNYTIDTTGLSLIYIRVFFFVHLLKAVFSFLVTCPRYVLQCDEKKYYNLIVDILCLIIFGTLKAIFIVKTRNYVIYIVLSIIEMVVSNLSIYLCVKSQYNLNSKFSKSDIRLATKDIVSYSKRIAIGDINVFINNCTDNVIISKICGTVTVALMSNYYLIIDTVKNFISQFFSAIEATIIKKINTALTNIECCDLFKTSSLISYVISSISCLFLFSLTDCFVYLFFGSEFSIGTLIPFLMTINLAITIFQYPSIYMISAKGLQNKTVFFSTIMMISNILLSIMFGLIIGERGILIATIVANLILMFGQDFVVSKYIINSNKNIFITKYFLFAMLILQIIICNLFVNKEYNYNSLVLYIFISIAIFIVFVSPFIIKNRKLIKEFFN